MSISYTPKYRLLLANVADGAIISVREVKSLMSLTANLATDTTMGQLTATWADEDFTTFATTVSRPKPMTLVQLQLTDYQGRWGIAWTGMADSITRTVNFGQNKAYTLQAVDPYKLFEITTQTVDEVRGLALDYAFGITGTAVLRDIAAPAVGYPGPFALLPAATGFDYSLALNKPGDRGPIDYRAEVAGYTWGSISSSVMVSPAQQTYSAILQSLIADTEVEMFFNEKGQLLWRPLAYLNIPERPRLIQKDTILNHSYTESDQGVVTRIYVRWGMLPTVFSQGVWPYPGTPADDARVNMEKALKPRILVFYTPWILSTDGANALAQALGLRYSGNMHTSQLTVIADPSIGVGTTIRVPKFPDLMPVDYPAGKGPKFGAVELTPWYYYYVYGKTYNLTVGGQWTMTLDLRYGRDEKLQFPYLGTTPYLQDNPDTHQNLLMGGQYGSFYPSEIGGSIQEAFPVAYDVNPGQPTKIATPFNIIVDPRVSPGSAVISPSIVQPGANINIVSGSGGTIGNFVTQSGIEHGVLNPRGYNIYVHDNPTHLKQGYVIIITDAPTSQGAFESGTATDPSGSHTTTPTSGDTSAGSGAGDGGIPTSSATGVLQYWPITPPPPATHIGQEFAANYLPQYEGRYPYVSAGPDVPYAPCFHTGTDFSVASGSPVYSPADGVVVGQIPPSGWGYGITGTDHTGYGFCLIIKAGPFYMLFAHLSQRLVNEGDSVGAGKMVARSGSSGGLHPENGDQTGGAHLHFGLYDMNADRDPIKYGKGRFVDGKKYLMAANAADPAKVRQ